MRFKLSKRSLANLDGAHPVLKLLAARAIEITKYDFGISESLRTMAIQEYNLATGASTTIHSKHLEQEDGTAHAFDYYALDEYGKYTKDHKYYRKINQAMVTAAIELSVQIELGGLWESFIDAGHVQIAGD